MTRYGIVPLLAGLLLVGQADGWCRRDQQDDAEEGYLCLESEGAELHFAISGSETARKRFPNGFTAEKPYLRVTAQP